MVAPLILGAARVVGSKRLKPAARKLSTKNAQPDLLKKTPETTQGKGVQKNPLTKGMGQLLPQDVLSAIDKVNTYSTCVTIFWTAIAFWPMQFIFWIVSVAAYGLETIPFLNYVLPGESIFWASWFFVVLVGWSMLLYAALFLFVRNVPAFVDYKWFIFILCLIGYLIPILNVFPWFVMWLLAIVALEKKSDTHGQ